MSFRGLAGALVAACAVCGSAEALTIGFTTPASSLAAATAAEATFLLGLSGAITESFEGFEAGHTVGRPGSPFETAVGSFVQVARGSTAGRCAGLGNCRGLAVLDAATSPYEGRFPMTGGPSDGQSNWLDSNDSRRMRLDVLPGYRAVGFYVTDPNDQGGLLQVRVSGSSSLFNFPNLFVGAVPSGSVAYVWLTDPAGIDRVTFISHDPNDGFGIDRVTIGDPVPEPGTLLLLGGGMLGLVARARRRRA
jgi:hypothetical protein